LFLFACSLASAAPTRILVLGDSLSAAYGIPKRDGWVSLLQHRLADNGTESVVINASITGDTTRGGLARLPDALQLHRPDIVIIELGGNDGLRGLDLDSTRNNLQRMIALSRESDARVLLLGVQLPANYGRSYREKFHAIYTGLAEQQQVALVDFFLQGVAETTELMQPDGIHPGSAAQPRILQNVWQGLAPLLPAAAGHD